MQKDLFNYILTEPLNHIKSQYLFLDNTPELLAYVAIFDDPAIVCELTCLRFSL